MKTSEKSISTSIEQKCKNSFHKIRSTNSIIDQKNCIFFRGTSAGATLPGRRARVLAQSVGRDRGERVVQRASLGPRGADPQGLEIGLGFAGSAAAATHRLAVEKALHTG